MRIAEILSEDLIIPELRASDQRAVLEELVDQLCVSYSFLSPDRGRVLDVLVDRERLGSTGVGEGVAIPHGKLLGIPRLVACFGRSRAGVEFRSLDGRPATLFFALLAPESSAGLHLKALARASRLFKSPELRGRLIEAHGRHEIWEILVSEDNKHV